MIEVRRAYPRADLLLLRPLHVSGIHQVRLVTKRRQRQRCSAAIVCHYTTLTWAARSPRGSGDFTSTRTKDAE
jgi:hypothetical protein